jgi:zinc transporter, ZIP family
MIFNLILMSFIVGSIGTGVGAVLALPMKAKNDGRFLYGFSSGFMLLIVMFDLIPSAVEISDMFITLAGITLGAAFVLIFHRILHKVYIGKNKSKIKETGLLLFVAIALHNFPEGVAIGAGFGLELSFAIFISVVMAAHNIPEGMAMGISLYSAGEKRSRVILYGLIAGVPICIGALVGNFVAHIGNNFIGAGLGFASGAMLYVCLSELIPYGKSQSGKKFYISFAIGLLIGQIVLILCRNLI